MKTFAIIENETVVNIVVCESLDIAEELYGNSCIEYTKENQAHIGSVYSAETGVFTYEQEEETE
jgi:hypothetical protein